MTELAAQYAISRKTGYKWLERYDAEGVVGLRDRSRRPHHSPQATDPDLVDALVAQRRRHPRWGAKKLLAVRRASSPAPRGRADRPCVRCSSSGAWCGRAGGANRPPPAAAAAGADHAPRTRCGRPISKGEFRTGDGVYCYPLTLRDGFSRFVLRCDALLGPTYEATRRGSSARLPSTACRIAFAATTAARLRAPGLARLSRLSVWWMRLGIMPERIAVGPSGAKWIARAISLGAQSRDDAAAGRERAAPSSAASPLLCRIQRRAAARSACGPAAGQLSISPRRASLPRACRRSTIRAISRSAASRQRVSRGAAASCFVSDALGRRRRRLRRSRRRPLDRALCHRRARSLRRTSPPDSPDLAASRRGAPPASLAPRLT